MIRRVAGGSAAAAPVVAIATGMIFGLLVVANAYGFHRDELYFIVAGRHPDWGYPDQPPLTPLLSAAAVRLLGPSPLAIRILPALAAAAAAVLAAVMAREFGATRRAQIVAMLTVAISGVLAAGHLDHTTTFDVLAWTIILALVVRGLPGGHPRLWWLVGITAGVGLENKQTIILLGLGSPGGPPLGRAPLPRAVAGGRGGCRAVGAEPRLAGWARIPQLEMARSVAREATENRVGLVPFFLLQAGPLLWPVAAAGLWWLGRAPKTAPWRAIGYAFLVVLAILIASGGKFYYALGFVPALLAAGAIPLDGWCRAGSNARRRRRQAAFAVAATLSGGVMAVGTLPILPPAILARTPIPALYEETAEQVGWPELAHTVEHAVATMPEDERRRAAIFTGNYGEAAALVVLGSADLPPVFSGHNGFGDWGPPPDSRDVVVLVGSWWPGTSTDFARDCRLLKAFDNGFGLANGEQGIGIWACRTMTHTWSAAWPGIKFLR